MSREKDFNDIFGYSGDILGGVGYRYDTNDYPSGFRDLTRERLEALVKSQEEEAKRTNSELLDRILNLETEIFIQKISISLPAVYGIIARNKINKYFIPKDSLVFLIKQAQSNRGYKANTICVFSRVLEENEWVIREDDIEIENLYDFNVCALPLEIIKLSEEIYKFENSEEAKIFMHKTFIKKILDK